jgi:hypothetical protein
MAFNNWRLYDFCDLKLLDYQMLPRALQAGFAIKDTGVGVEEANLIADQSCEATPWVVRKNELPHWHRPLKWADVRHKYVVTRKSAGLAFGEMWGSLDESIP